MHLLRRPAGGAFLAAERRGGVRAGGPRPGSHTRPAGEDTGPRGHVEDRRLVLHRGSAGKSGAQQLQVTATDMFHMHFLIFIFLITVHFGLLLFSFLVFTIYLMTSQFCDIRLADY